MASCAALCEPGSKSSDWVKQTSRWRRRGLEPGSGDPVGETKFLVFIATKKVETRGKEKFFSLHNDKFVLDRFFIDLSKQQGKSKNEN